MVVTSCGQVVCNNCQPKLVTRQCQKCRGPCTRNIPLNEKAPKEVLNLFTDISEQLKAVFKNYNFQETQKKSLLDYKERKVGQMKMHLGELAKKKNSEQELHNKMREKLAYLENKEAQMKEKLNRMTLEPSRNMGGGEVNLFVNKRDGGVFGGLGQVPNNIGIVSTGHQFRGGVSPTQAFFGGGIQTLDAVERAGGFNRSGGQLGSNGGFLEMKTPAVWYHKQRGREDQNKIARKSPQQMLAELEASGKRSGGSSKASRAPFFTSPPPGFSPKVTPTRKHF